MIRIFSRNIFRKMIIGCTFVLFAGYSGLTVRACETEDYAGITEYSDEDDIDTNELVSEDDAIEETAVEEITTEEKAEEEAVIDTLSVDGINEEESFDEEFAEDGIVAAASYMQPIYNGIDYSDVYDFDFYIAHNPDVKNAYGDNQADVLAHFVNYGMNEGRQAKASFNVYSYAYKYPDLRRAYGNSLSGYYYHYIYYGKNEGRIAVGTNVMQGAATVYEGVDYSPVYDYNYYTSLYPDIKSTFGIDDYACLMHFINYGMSEGRRGNENFDEVSYKNTYKDLRMAFMNNLREYYIHYLYYGKNEGRIAKGNTKITDYVTNINGIDYSSVYDFNYYTNRYPDIKNAYSNDDVGALQHFITSGMAEGRQGKEAFDVWAYGYSYADLRGTFGNDVPRYYEHYMNFGKNEGRSLTAGVASSNNENTVYAGYDFSSIYDIVFYTGHNIDVRNAYKFDENAILEHFAQYGLKEGRIALASYSAADYETAKVKVAEYNKKLEEEQNIIKYPKAVNVLNQIGWNLNSAFNWAAGLRYYSGVSKVPDPGINYFGNFGFDNGRGNCYVLAAVFYEMAYSMGYNVRQISGTVPLVSGGQGPHSWVEIDMDGGTYVFDPDYTNYTKKSGFKFTYGTSGTWIYNKIEVMHE